VDGDVTVTYLGQPGRQREATGVEGAYDGVLPDDAVGERASPVGALGLRRGEAAPAQAKDGDVVPGHAERAALPERDLVDRAQPVLHEPLGGAHVATAIGAANWLAVTGRAASVCQGST